MHRLVHIASVWWLDGHGEQATWADKAVTRLEELVPYGGHERKEVWTRYLSYAVHVAGLDSTVKEIVRASLLDRVGRCQASLGQYPAAETTHGQASLLREKMLGPEHPSTLRSVYCLAHLLANQHCYSESLALYQRARAAHHTVLGKDHPTTRTCRQHYTEAKMHATEE